MRPLPTHHGTEARSSRAAQRRSWFRRPTLRGTAKATLHIVLALVLGIAVIVPAVFAVVPISPEAEAITLCLPGIGPLQRFSDDLQGEQEELTYIHESVHAAQCRTLGAAAFNRKITSVEGRLSLEAQALCAEAAVLSMRGADPKRLAEHAVEALASAYFDHSDLERQEIAAAVRSVCGASIID